MRLEEREQSWLGLQFLWLYGGGTLLAVSQQWKDSTLQEEDDDVQCELPLGLLSRDVGSYIVHLKFRRKMWARNKLLDNQMALPTA